MSNPRWALVVATIFLLICGFLWYPASLGAVPSASRRGSANVSEPITHVVSHSFRDGAGDVGLELSARRMMSLKDSCIHPNTSRPYIRSLKGGVDESAQGYRGFVFIIEFDSKEDRNYFVQEDVRYKAFLSGINGIIQQSVTMNFVPGNFELPPLYEEETSVSDSALPPWAGGGGEEEVPMADNAVATSNPSII